MKSFSQFLHNPTFRKGGLKESLLKEYLTPEQEERYSRVPVTPGVKQMTNHFFGEGNDSIREEIPNYNFDKSEVHRSIERHLGQDIEIDDYIKGHAKDKYGRKVRIGALLNDSFRKAKNETEKADIQKLQNSFTSDNSRAGRRATTRPYMTIHRGTQVAGQTNGAATATHPQGHSWAGQSCKNIDTGSNNNYLSQEIKAGTVVVFAHDHTGQEIYRATLQPHFEDSDDKSQYPNTITRHIYVRDSEYGVKNQAFTRHADDIAKRLSSPVQEGDEDKEFRIHPSVYNDSGNITNHHPALSEDTLLKSAKEAAQRLDNSQSPFEDNESGKKKTKTFVKVAQRMTMNYQTSPAAISTLHKVVSGLDNHIGVDVKTHLLQLIVRHPNASSEIHEYEMRRVPTIRDENSPQKGTRQAFGDDARELFHIKNDIFYNGNVAPEIYHMAVEPEAYGIHYKPEQFQTHIANTPEAMDSGMKAYKYELARRAITMDKKSKLPRDVIERAARHPNGRVRATAMSHRKADDAIFDIGIGDRNVGTYENILSNPNITDNHRMKMLENLKNPHEFTIDEKASTYYQQRQKDRIKEMPTQIVQDFKNPDILERVYHASLSRPDVIEGVLRNPNTPESVIRHAIGVV